MADRRRIYSEEEKRVAVALAKRIGVRPAARELGIPRGSVFNWMSRLELGDPVGPAVTEEGRRSEAPRKRVARIYTPSQRAEILEYAAVHGVTRASKKFGASRFSIYGWRRRVERAAAGEGEAPTSGPDPHDIVAQRDREILELWERHPGLGPSQIKNQLRRQGVRVSTNTVRRVMEDAGYATVGRDPTFGHVPPHLPAKRSGMAMVNKGGTIHRVHGGRSARHTGSDSHSAGTPPGGRHQRQGGPRAPRGRSG